MYLAFPMTTSSADTASTAQGGDPSPLDETSSAVQSHITALQGLITRMASNSASTKTWCVSLVAAIVVLASKNSTSLLIGVALLPALLFMYLDAYYLGLERAFRRSHEEFVRKLHIRTLVLGDLYQFRPISRGFKDTWDAVTSPAVWPFYGCLIGMLVIAYLVLSAKVGGTP